MATDSEQVSRKATGSFGKMKKKTMRVAISDSHFAQGVQGSPSECPLALALKDLGYEDVSVSRVGSDIDGETWVHDQRTEAALQCYDDAGILSPRSAVLTLLQEPSNAIADEHCLCLVQKSLAAPLARSAGRF